MIEETKITLLNPAGRVITVEAKMKKELLSKGFRIITNPKEEYYPSFDSKNVGWQPNNVVENIEPGSFLEVEKI